MTDISTTNKKARVPILGENGRISDAYLPQAVIDAEASSKTYAENAKSYSELVKKDAESASSSAASAKASADAAREGISSIDEKVTQAGQFAEASSSSATEANNYLKQVTTVSGTVSGIASSVAENAQVAETFANKSKESAASALTASTSAVNAKVDAEGYRDSAKSYSDNAKADADTAKNILESVKTQKADVDSTVQQFNTDAAEYDTKFNGYVSEARESKEASAASATSASESAENASTSAANASASEVKAKTSADAAALSETNASNSAKEVADNLSLLGASTLTRKEKDTFIHVDDAFPSSLLAIEVDGACRQDGTPSPDNPVPIQVVENPVVKVVGRNLLDNKYPAYTAAYNNRFAIIKKYAYDHPNIMLPFTTGPRSSDGFGFIEKLKPNVTYTLKGFNVPSKACVCIAGYKRVEDVDTASNAIWNIAETSMKGPVSFLVKEGGEYVVFTFAAEWGDGTNKITYPADFKVTVEHGDTATEYKPYTSQSLAFMLPAEHPYLAKLPDGTADEIRVDRDGNVSLVANVGHMTLAEFGAITNVECTDQYEQALAAGSMSGFRSYSKETPTNRKVMCTSLPSLKNLWNNAILGTEWVDGMVVHFPWDVLGITEDNSFNARRDKFKAYASGKTDVHIYYGLGDSTKKTYQLGKIEMPKAKDSVTNVWTDAEVTPRTGIEYTRDVNIVVANLESAIASITEG